MKHIIYLLISVCLMSFTYQANAQTQKKVKVMVAKHVEPEKKTKNPSIKSEAPETDNPVAKPSATRGSCTVSFTNSTGYYVKVYIDGNYKGTLAPYESGNVTVYSGYTTVYCITTG